MYNNIYKYKICVQNSNVFLLQICVESCNEKRHLCGETGDVNVYIVELMYEFRTLLVKKKIMLTCALRAYFKVSKGRKLYLIAQKNLMFKRYNKQFIKEYYYIYTLNMCLKSTR
jgi:Fe-S-cluster-containing dehydrogenase component